MIAFASHLAAQIFMKMRVFATRRLSISQVELTFHFAAAGL